MVAALEILLQEWRERLRAWSADGSLASAARHALQFGSDDPPLLAELVDQWTDGDFTALPPIMLLPASSMPGAAGAYAFSTGTIYLNEDWLEAASDERAIAVLTEELGHHLDGLLNQADTLGDEGELISRLLLNTDLNADQHQALRHEHDQIQILLDGEWIDAEASDSPAPSTPDLIAASDSGSSDTDNLTNDTTPTFTGTAEAFSTVELFSDGNSLGSTTTDGSGNWSFSVPDESELADGSYAISATATTGSGGLQSRPIAPAFPGRTTHEIRNLGAFAALKEDGSVITWGDSRYGGDGSSVSADLQFGVSQIFSSRYAFAALKGNGSVITWGAFSEVGDDSRSVSDKLQSGVVQISSTNGAFAALKEDGSVITWGKADFDGGDSSSVSDKLQSGVVEIFSNFGAFAALKNDGSVVTWGHSSSGGDSSSPNGSVEYVTTDVKNALQSGVVEIFSNANAFAALKNDGSVVTWGHSSSGGNSRNVLGSVNAQLSSGVAKIFTTGGAFSALKDDGSVVTWGHSSSGGDGRYVSSQLRTGVANIFSTGGAFAALKDDGSVVTWGDTRYGGYTAIAGVAFSSVSEQLKSGVAQIFSTRRAFAALKEDGSVITWGDAIDGGDSSSVSDQLQSGVTKIFSTDYAFAALKEGGGVVTWGRSDYGGNSSSVSNTLQSDVSQLFSTDRAFAALKDDGSVVTWGDSSSGGDSSSVADQLQSGVVSFADPFHDDRLVAGTSGSSLSSAPSPALIITIDTTAPVITSAASAKAIDENSGAGKRIYTAAATDISSVSYSLKADNNDDAAAFSIDSLTGEVTLTADPDYENQSTYAFTVVATDAARNSTEQEVTLAINDIQEIPPGQLFISSQSIRAGSTFAIPINVSDATGVEPLDLRLSYDPTIFSLPATGSLVTPGSLTPGATFVVNNNPPGQVSISWAGSTPLSSGTGSIATLNLQVRSDATPGETSLIDILSVHVKEGRATRITSEALDGSISILPPLFQIQAVRAMPNGIALAFPEAPDMDAFNLYDGPEDVAVDQPDLTLTGPNGESVALSAHWQASSNELLLLTSDPLATGDYTLTIDSRSDGLISASSGELLDGNGDGTPGDPFAFSFSHTTPEHLLSVADTARGAGQQLSLNGSGTHDPLTGEPLADSTGLPIHLSTSSSLTSFSGSLSYDQQLLLTPELNTDPSKVLRAGSDLPDDWTLSIDPSSQPGELLYSATGSTAITGSNLEILRFQATISSIAAPPEQGSSSGNDLYGATTLIQTTFSSDQLPTDPLTGTPLDVDTDPGLIALAYAGDTTGNGTLSSLDASRVQRVVVELDSGFDAYDTIHPVLIGDTTGNGTLSSLDASRIQQQVVGLPVDSFPGLPIVDPIG